MSDEVTKAHKQFAVDCFNRVWELLDKGDRRTAEEDRAMVELAHASLSHWMNCEDCTPTNVSIGLWQISRVYAVVGNWAEAMRYAGECIQVSDGEPLPPFYRACGYEAAARAAMIQGDASGSATFLRFARELAGQVEEEEDRALLLRDLDELDPGENSSTPRPEGND